jgi:hypothetical protein
MTYVTTLVFYRYPVRYLLVPKAYRICHVKLKLNFFTKKSDQDPTDPRYGKKLVPDSH